MLPSKFIPSFKHSLALQTQASLGSTWLSSLYDILTQFRTHALGIGLTNKAFQPYGSLEQNDNKPWAPPVPGRFEDVTFNFLSRRVG
jgi:hypothetical protein